MWLKSILHFSVKDLSTGQHRNILKEQMYLTMSVTLILPVPKTMALGGVATGNIKAKEAHTAAGIIRYKG